MSAFFGTDGLRGVVNNELTGTLATNCGNALGAIKQGGKILIGRDTRLSCNYLMCAFSAGCINAGSSVIDLGICPTPAIAFLTRKLNADFGVVISASHNSMEYNGIKIFDEKGLKLGDKREENLEKNFITTTSQQTHKLGQYNQKFNLVNKYVNYLINACNVSLNGLKIVLDASNGACYNIAPKVFKRLGAEIIKINCTNNGLKINDKCGALYPEKLVQKVLEVKADLGFSFDGDGDRIIACDASGKLFDGDQILYILASYLKEQNELKSNIIVGTQHTNMGVEIALKKLNLTLIRTDIGDKYVSQKIEQLGASLGGEKSGHIIIRKYLTSGDGILCAIKLAEICKSKHKTLSELCNIMLYEQVNINCISKNKMRVINNEMLLTTIEEEKLLNPNARIMVRVSGTEPKIRIMVEDKSFIIAKKCAEKIKEVITKIEGLEE